MECEIKFHFATVYLGIIVKGSDGFCRFCNSKNGIDFKTIGEGFFAFRVLWSSAKIGIFSTSEPNYRIGGYADFDWFRISK